MNGLELQPELIRLRENANERVTKVYRDDVILEQYSMFEGKQIAIQILKEPEIVDPDSILIMLRCWNPATWELTPMKEILVKRYSTMDEFSNVIHQEYPFIERKNIECCKVMTVQTFFRLQLPHEKWFGLIANENFLAASPFYLSTDGLLFIAKDNTLVERDLSVDEKAIFGITEFESTNFAQNNIGGGKRGYVPKEKAMKINVKKKKKKDAFDNFEIIMPEDYENSKQEETSATEAPSNDVTMESVNQTEESETKTDVKMSDKEDKRSEPNGHADVEMKDES